MGIANVNEAFALWGHLDHAPFRVFLYMAKVARDDDPRFWQGREALALAIGRGPSELADPTIRKAAYRAVARATAALVKAGAVVVTAPARPGRNAEYTLNLSMERVTVSDTHMDDVQRHPLPLEIGAGTGSAGGVTGDVQRSNGRRSADTRVTFSGYPRREQEEEEEFKKQSGTERREVTPARTSALARGKNLSIIRGAGRPKKGLDPPGLWPAAVPDLDPQAIAFEDHEDGEPWSARSG